MVSMLLGVIGFLENQSLFYIRTRNQSQDLSSKQHSRVIEYFLGYEIAIGFLETQSHSGHRN